MELMLHVLFWSVLATIVACIEIESEGKEGWAYNMPTWYRTTGFWAKLYGLAMSGKPLTGYHAFMFFLPIMMVHSQFFMGVEWTIVGELMAWALYFAWCPLWDFHWFILNPHFAGRFHRDEVWWHAKSWWVGGLFPVDYAFGIGLSVAFAALASWYANVNIHIGKHLLLLAGFGFYTGILASLSPAYHRWYRQMRTRDDRGRTKGFR